LQLNAMEPVIIFNILDSIRILSRAMGVLTDRCVIGIEADAGRCEALLRGSLVLATALVPVIGYENAAKIAKAAQADGSSIAETAIKLGLISESELDEAFSLERVLGPAGNVVRPSDGTAT
jgi:aspartate ammonia-lyase